MTHLPYISARGGVNTAPSAPAQLRVLKWTEVAPPRNSLVGFADIRLTSGIVIRGLTVHEKNGSRWVSMPARPVLKNGIATGDWVATLDFDNDRVIKEKFRVAALAAVDRFLAGEVAR